ncbi:hypothetical protein CU102_08720 [Phyllobacterium brassicacearum]|uniref:Uncharacterized protein n=1 Tax=Phyllobacterium brassicacearum TaxID=314235 RepID=A0A2P7BSK6_9HYPH|nr:hypothetical protein [Phyllobacterium brassicacearum]PSH69450.1 hypothetical protein CU102_08720 [Phyllobacterium brassicacearum]TDQ34366.1 hypothetical protein DEV91_10397 [Phyllobacterium brassicacearum]
MFFSDKGTRDLLPLIELHLDEIPVATTAFDGDPTPAANVPHHAVPQAMQPAGDLPSVEEQRDDDTEAFSNEEQAPPAIHIQEMPGGNGSTVHEISIPIDHLTGNPVSFTFRGATGELEHNGGATGKLEPTGDANQPGPESQVIGPHSPASEVPTIPEDGHTINVTQLAVVEQDASIFVSGYVGEVVARLHIDQSLMMDQDVDISFTIDGEGHFSVLLDQDMRIDQDIWVDINIYDEDGVLYVDVFLRDAIEVDQDTTIDVEISDGPPGGTVEINQDIELDQDVHVQVDIEDDLEERYIIRTSVDVVQSVDADETAVVGITGRDGETDIDIDAVQTAYVDQETIVHADFTLV